MQERLTPFQVAATIHLTQMGVVLFTLPRIMAETYGYNGWLLLIVHAVAVQVNILLIGLVYKRGQGQSIFDILERPLRKWMCYPIYMFLICIWSLLGCLSAKKYVLIFEILAHPSIYPMLLKALMDVLAFFLIIKGTYNMTKAATVFFWLISWMITLLFFHVHEFEWSRMTTFFFHEAGDLHLYSILNVHTSFLGYELSLLLMPYMGRDPSFSKAVSIGHWFTVFNYLAVCIVCFGFFSFQQLKHHLFPAVNLLSFIELPFIERLENLLFAFFLITNLWTVVMYIWAAKEAFQRIMPKAKPSWIAFFLLAVAYAIAWIPAVYSEVERWLIMLGGVQAAIAAALPLLLLILLKIYKGEEQRVQI